MLAPTLMYLILVSPYLGARTVLRGAGERGLRSAGAAGVGLLFLFTASGHFLQTGPMVQMLPSWFQNGNSWCTPLECSRSR